MEGTRKKKTRIWLMKEWVLIKVRWCQYSDGPPDIMTVRSGRVLYIMGTLPLYWPRKGTGDQMKYHPGEGKGGMWSCFNVNAECVS